MPATASARIATPCHAAAISENTLGSLLYNQIGNLMRRVFAMFEGSFRDAMGVKEGTAVCLAEAAKYPTELHYTNQIQMPSP